jgi:hypothetical protein
MIYLYKDRTHSWTWVARVPGWCLRIAVPGLICYRLLGSTWYETPHPCISCLDITCIFSISFTMPSIKLIALPSHHVVLNFMLCPRAKIWSTTAHSSSGPDVGAWHVPCIWFLRSSQFIPHTTCCTCMGSSVYVQGLWGVNCPWTSLSMWMCFILLFP